MSLISQFVTHFWSGCLWGLWGYMGQQGVFSLYYLNSKVRKAVMFVRWLQSAGCRLEQGAATLLGLASPTFVGILTSAFKCATTAALTARVGRIFALNFFRPHGFLHCAIDGGLKTFGVGPLCGDLCSKSIQRIWLDVYFVALFQHQLYIIRRKHLFAHCVAEFYGTP